MITETRISSVDALPELPGYQPITMHDLWMIADKASDVVLAARRHLEPTDEAAWEILGDAISGLLFVMDYTVRMRSV